jgi:hypothetical protein
MAGVLALVVAQPSALQAISAIALGGRCTFGEWHSYIAGLTGD